MYMTFSSQSACMHATIISDVFHSLYSETDIRVEKEDSIVWIDDGLQKQSLFYTTLLNYTLYLIGVSENISNWKSSSI